jgi:phospholipid/cholesterol/gamma-HCH transport system substrate-binding protein
METHYSQFKARLGVFVAVGFALLIAGIFYIGRQKHMFNPVVTLNTTFKNISGLEVGNNVRFSGINVGTVDNITIINDSTVKVYLIVEKDVQQFIKTDSYVRITSDGLIGDKIANITQGSSQAGSVVEGQHLRSIEPLETDAILANLKATGENATVISGELAEILHKVNKGNGTISRLLHDTTIAENLGQTITYLKRSSRGLDENMEAAKHNFLLRGFFKNKKKKQEEAERDKERKKQDIHKKDAKDKNKGESWRERWKRKKQERQEKKEQAK